MVDYRKWDKIEISDDEDEQHPNIDKASLNKWRHEARIERERKRQEDKRECLLKKQAIERQIEKLKSSATGEGPGASTAKAESDDLEEKLKKLELEKKEWEKKEQEVLDEERKAPWNVDSLSKDGFAKTLINKPIPREDRSKLSDEVLAARYTNHVNLYEKKMKQYCMFSRVDDARNFLLENLQLVCEESSNYLTLHALNLAIEGKNDLMKHIARQVVTLNYILELSKHMDIDPRSCVVPFFNRIQKADAEYIRAFEDEILAFIGRIEKRAKEKIDEAVKEIAETEKAERIKQSPGGLDPEEVFDSLPDELKECFTSRDVERLQTVISTMDRDSAIYHIKRCVDSGLWVPDESSPLHPKNQHATEAGDSVTTASGDNHNEEDIYEEARTDLNKQD